MIVFDGKLYIFGCTIAVPIFVGLFKKAADEHAQRDYLFYLAVGHTRLHVSIYICVIHVDLPTIKIFFN